MKEVIPYIILAFVLLLITQFVKAYCHHNHVVWPIVAWLFIVIGIIGGTYLYNYYKR